MPPAKEKWRRQVKRGLRLWNKTPGQRNRCATHVCFNILGMNKHGKRDSGLKAAEKGLDEVIRAQHTAGYRSSCRNSASTSNDQDKLDRLAELKGGKVQKKKLTKCWWSHKSREPKLVWRFAPRDGLVPRMAPLCTCFSPQGGCAGQLCHLGAAGQLSDCTICCRRAVTSFSLFVSAHSVASLCFPSSPLSSPLSSLYLRHVSSSLLPFSSVVL